MLRETFRQTDKTYRRDKSTKAKAHAKTSYTKIRGDNQETDKTGDKEGRHQAQVQFLLQHLQQAQVSPIINPMLLQKPPFLPTLQNSHDLANRLKATHRELRSLRVYMGGFEQKSIWGRWQKASLFASRYNYFRSQQKKKKNQRQSLNSDKSLT